MVNKMNEAIGVKGGKRDRKRRIIITANQKKKLKENYKRKKQERIKKLEKEVKNLQLVSFLVAVPISVAGTTVETLLNLREEQKDERLQAKGLQIEERAKAKALQTEELHQANKLELGESAIYIEDYQSNDRKFTDYGYPKTIDGKEVVSYPDKKIITIEKKEYPKVVEAKVSLEENNKNITLKETLEQPNKQQEESLEQQEVTEKQKKVEVKEQKQTIIPIPESKKEILEENNIFQKITDKKIVAEYEEKLKDIKIELKKLIYEYNVLQQASEDLTDSKEAEEILYQLSIIIKKIEELKSKMKIDIKDLETEAYLTDIVDQYMDEFKNKNIVSEIKDSDLYIMIAEKLEEVTEKTGTLTNKVEDTKEKLELDEAQFDKLKESYYNFENFNNQLIAFQSEQDFLLKDLEKKVSESTSITEQVQYRVQLMNRQNRRLLQMIALPMLIPGNRSARAVASATAAYLYFMRNLLNPRLRQQRYRIISVIDYSSEIEKNISKIEDAAISISKTSNKLEEMIRKIEVDFKDYMDTIPECRELLSNLNKLLSDLKEKEEELQKTKQEQEKLLETNNQKVKTLPRTEEV